VGHEEGVCVCRKWRYGISNENHVQAYYPYNSYIIGFTSRIRHYCTDSNRRGGGNWYPNSDWWRGSDWYGDSKRGEDDRCSDRNWRGGDDEWYSHKQQSI
jgi:hypothetical protein